MSTDYGKWLSARLADPSFAQGYLEEAKRESPEMFDKAARRVLEANGVNPPKENLWQVWVYLGWLLLMVAAAGYGWYTVIAWGIR